jgi:PKD repeat protein
MTTKKLFRLISLVLCLFFMGKNYAQTCPPRPIAALRLQNNDICLGQPVSVLNLSNANGNGVFYIWDWGDGTKLDTLQDKASAVHTYERPVSDMCLQSNGGFVYRIKLTAQNRDKNCSSHSTSTDAYAYFNPITDFTAPQETCNPVVDFLNKTCPLTTPSTILWDFGDPASGIANTSSEANPQHRFTKTGSFKVTLKTSSYCGSSVKERTIIVREVVSIAAQIDGPTTVCAGNTAILTASAGSSYKWSTGQMTPSVSITQSGTYYVTVSDANGCSRTASKIVAAKSSVIATITGDTLICSGTNANLTASGGTSYLWSTGATTPTIPVSQSGTYNVTVSNANSCSGMATKKVIFNASISASISGKTSFCAGDSSVLTAAGGDTYKWSNGATTAQMTITKAGIYTVTATNTSGCTGSSTQEVSTKPKPIVTISGNATICETSTGKVPIFLTANGGSFYKWSTGQTTPSVSINTGGNYNVIVTDSSGCSTTVSKTIASVKTIGAITVRDKGIICRGEQITLKASGGTTYAWSSGISSADFLAKPTETTEYSVTISSNNCTEIKKQVITVVSNPTAGFAYSVSDSNKVSFINKSVGATSYFWNFGNDSTSTLENPKIKYKIKSPYSVCLTAFVSSSCTNMSCLLINTATAIQELPKDVSVTISPNPTSNRVDIKVAHSRPFRQDEKITVYDWLGRKVYELSNLSLINSVDMSNFANGIYFFRLTMEGNVYTLEKVVKGN